MSERPPISPRSPRAALEPEQVPPPPKRSDRARNPFVVAGNAVITIVLVLMVGGGGAYIYGKQKIEAPGPLQEDKIVNIPTRAGMGDIVFAPFYEVLRNRGVSFEFFHRLERVRLASPGSLGAGERPHVHALEFDLQAKVSRGEYQPLFDLDGLPCWPSKPDYSQLNDGARLEDEGRDFESHWDRRRVGTRTLLASRDFDFAVLGVGFGAVPYVCQDLIKRDRRWRDLVKHLKTVETQAFQLWMREDMSSLGWNNPPVALSAFVQPFETWADMGHLIEEERWPSRPRAIRGDREAARARCSAVRNRSLRKRPLRP